MAEKEKMLAGKIYDPTDPELSSLRAKAHRLIKEYNNLLENDPKRQETLKGLGIEGDSFSTCRDRCNSTTAVSLRLGRGFSPTSTSPVLTAVQ